MESVVLRTTWLGIDAIQVKAWIPDANTTFMIGSPPLCASYAIGLCLRAAADSYPRTNLMRDRQILQVALEWR